MKTELLYTAVETLIQKGRITVAERTTEADHLTVTKVDVLRLMGNGDSGLPPENDTRYNIAKSKFSI